MVQVQTKTLTVSEFLKLPETEPASEYINGEIIQKPMPRRIAANGRRFVRVVETIAEVS